MASSDARSWRRRSAGDSERTDDRLSSARSSGGRSRGGRGRPRGAGRERVDESVHPTGAERARHGRESHRRAPVRAGEAGPRETGSAVVGTCMQMCSRAEVLERTRTLEISRFEQPGAGPFAAAAADGKDVFSLAVKKYRRAAAGQIETDAAELRPPRVLLDTLEHLFARVLTWPGCGFDWQASSDAGAHPQFVDTSERAQRDFLALYHFVSDRVRSVRKDFTVQRIEDASAVLALEQSARFYILASLRAKQVLPSLRDVRASDWSETLNDQQLASALAQLHELYAKPSVRAMSLSSSSEFVAYDILLHADDASAVSFLLRTVSPSVRSSAPVQRATALFVALQTSDSWRVQALYAQASALEKSLVLRHLPARWCTGVHVLNKAFGKLDTFALSELAQWLALPGPDAARELCSALAVHVEDAAPSAAPVPPSESWEDANGTLPAPCPSVVRFKVAPLRMAIADATTHSLLAAAARRIHAADLHGVASASDVVLCRAPRA